jgi:predicted DNA-binding transcriptional regulator AlpA
VSLLFKGDFIEHSSPILEAHIRLKPLLKLVPISKSTWYRGIKAGIYPALIRIAPRVSAWRLSELEACLKHLGSVFGKAEEVG